MFKKSGRALLTIRVITTNNWANEVLTIETIETGVPAT